MKTNRIAKGLVALSAALALTACGTSLGSIADVGATTSSGTTSSAVATTATDGSYTIHAQADDVDYDASTAKTIALGSGNVEITEPGTYILTGTLSNGQVIVNSSAEGKVRIVLSNASITNSSGAAIDVRAADEVVVVLAEGTSNSLTDGSGYDTSGEDAADAALFSMADLTIGGTGSLIVTGNTADGIASKDGLVILGGTITVKAADDGIRGKDYLVIQDGTLDVTSAQDGLKSTNETDAQYGDIVISGGMNVDLATVERAVRSWVAETGRNDGLTEPTAGAGAMNTVSDAAVVGVPHPEWGTEVVAVVETGQRPRLVQDPRPDSAVPATRGGRLSLSALRHSLSAELPHYALPRRLLIQTLPRTSGGKIDRRRLVADLSAPAVSEPTVGDPAASEPTFSEPSEST